jgi:hypothetical protein
MAEVTLDPQTGGLSLTGMKNYTEARKPLSPMGQLIADRDRLIAEGVDENDPRMKGLMAEILKQPELPDAQKRYLNWLWENEGPTAVWAALKEIKATGAPKVSVGLPGIKVVTPSAEQQEKLHLSGLMNEKLKEIDTTFNAIMAKNPSWFAQPTGWGAETINNVRARFKKEDPLVSRLHAMVSEYESMQIRLMAGLNQTVQEAMRTKGYLINNQLPLNQFKTRLDLNRDWSKNDYDERWFMSKELGAEGIRLPKKEVTGAGEGGAAKENKSGETKNALGQDLDAIRRRRKELEKKAREGKKEPAPETPAPAEPGAMLFNRYMERERAFV